MIYAHILLFTGYNEYVALLSGNIVAQETFREHSALGPAALAPYTALGQSPAQKIYALNSGLHLSGVYPPD